MELILIRHGESTTNAIQDPEKRIFTGQFDCGLSAKGMQQALKLSDDPLLVNADVWFSSDLRRAVETARLITDRDITIDKRLRERSLGDFEGKTVEEIKHDPLYSKYFHDPEYSQFRHGFKAKAPNGENYSDVCERVSSFLKELNGNYGKAVIVSHSCAIRCIIKTVERLSCEETLHIMVKNCEPVAVRYERTY